MTDLVLFRQQLDPLAPRFADVLGKSMQVQRFIQSVMISCERLPVLLDPDKVNRQSLFNAAMSAAMIGLPVDGVLGQAYIVPFKGKAQLLIGYKGLGTLAARGSYMIAADVIREGDKYSINKAARTVTHEPIPNNDGRIIGAWSCASSLHLPQSVEVVWLDELLAIRQRASANSPAWKDEKVGYPAMCMKTARRRQQRSLPYGELPQFHMAAVMDEAHEERGLYSRIDPDKGVIIEGEVMPERETETAPTASDLTEGRKPTLTERGDKLYIAIHSAKTRKKVGSLWTVNEALREELRDKEPDLFEKIAARYDAAMEELPAEEVDAQ